MGLEIRFTEEHFPLSYDLAQFLHQVYFGGEVETRGWFDQHKESNYYLDRDSKLKKMETWLGDINSSEQVKDHIRLAYQVFADLICGKYKRVRELFSKFEILFVIGLPRTGGTFITKELYNSTGIDYNTVPYSIGHDGFPSLNASMFGRLESDECNNTVLMYKSIAEYLVMLRVFYTVVQSDGVLVTSDKSIVVPKKLCNVPYHYNGIFKALFPSSTMIVTYRDPLGFLNSVMDKSKRTHPMEPFEVKLIIDLWAKELLESRNIIADTSRTYADVMLDYHKVYYEICVSSGMLSSKTNPTLLVEFGPEMKRVVEVLGLPVVSKDEFIVKPSIRRHHKNTLLKVKNQDRYLRKILGIKHRG